MDLRQELVFVPVADVDRAKVFCVDPGWLWHRARRERRRGAPLRGADAARFPMLNRSHCKLYRLRAGLPQRVQLNVENFDEVQASYVIVMLQCPRSRTSAGAVSASSPTRWQRLVSPRPAASGVARRSSRR